MVHQNCVVDRVREFQEALSIVHEYLNSRSIVLVVESHAIPTGQHCGNTIEHGIYEKEDVRLLYDDM